MQEENKYSYDISQEPIVISKPTLDLLLQCDHPARCLALYSFYYYIAKHQQSNEIAATNGYVKSCLHWGDQKLQSAKKQLIVHGLIENKKVKSPSNQITKHHIKINFFWTDKNREKAIALETQAMGKPRLWENGQKKKYTKRKYNNNYIIYNKRKKRILPRHFDDFYKIYPKKANKGAALSAWQKLCNKKDRPTIGTILKAVKQQSNTLRWRNKFIPNPSTWINQSRWLDEIEPMNQDFDFGKNNKANNGNSCQDPTQFEYYDQ